MEWCRKLAWGTVRLALLRTLGLRDLTGDLARHLIAFDGATPGAVKMLRQVPPKRA